MYQAGSPAIAGAWISWLPAASGPWHWAHS
jgi:hypothetical protein